jgi:hypothetical protein
MMLLLLLVIVLSCMGFRSSCQGFLQALSDSVTSPLALDHSSMVVSVLFVPADLC